MFASHLDQQHHALVPSGAHGGAGMGNLPSLAADVTTNPNIPAPLGTGSEWIKKALLIGGIALVVFLLLRMATKKK